VRVSGPPPELEVVGGDPRVDQALGIFADLQALEVTPTGQVGAREILILHAQPRSPSPLARSAYT
jgi:hypothetical protein